MSMYTVICLYPDYSSDDYGADIFVDSAETPDPYAAASAVQLIASLANDGNIPPDDFRVIAVMAGDIQLELDATNF